MNKNELKEDIPKEVLYKVIGELLQERLELEEEIARLKRGKNE